MLLIESQDTIKSYFKQSEFIFKIKDSKLPKNPVKSLCFIFIY